MYRDYAKLGLGTLFALQEELEGSWGRLPNPEDSVYVSQYIRDNVLAATDELHEVLGEVHWKPWKDNHGIKDIGAYREELADVMHFIINLYLAGGLTSADMVDDFMAKHDVNMKRTQSQEYRGK